MIFSYQVTTPKSTSASNPQITPLQIGRGVIHFWSIQFPPGNEGTLRMRIKKGGDFILPINPDSYLLGDGSTFHGEDFVFVDREPYELDLYSWNTDTINSHTIYISIFQKPIWTFSPYSEGLAELVEREATMRTF